MGKVGIRELYRNVLFREPYFGRRGQRGPKVDDLLNMQCCGSGSDGSVIIGLLESDPDP